uniref:1-alkyl-2-acetylglycerophosphocholine esterase n=1 Tax=Erpetoichthys calabaricus TaxID=27687 RepID=A0A8C4TED4_ERPCA
MWPSSHIHIPLCVTFFLLLLQIWRELFSPLHALNFGIGGDATQHVLWRLQNGELDHINPKVVVVWVGTNNHGHTAEQVAECQGAILVSKIYFIALGSFASREEPKSLREKNTRVNEFVQQALPTLPWANFLNLDDGFVHSDGTISHNDMYDYLHLTRAAYARVCRPLYDKVKRLLEEQDRMVS